MAPPPEDLQMEVVRQFWDNPKLDSLKAARLVAFGLCVRLKPSGLNIMEDRPRFQAVLDQHTGVDQWLNEPRPYRRCYQGLIRSYFMYDPKSGNSPTVGRKNWSDLRDYLHQRAPAIIDNKFNPNWVTVAADNRRLFTETPCEPYADDVLFGNSSKINLLCEQLGVIKASWFLRDLILAQVECATRFEYKKFTSLIPQLLKLLSNNDALRDRGLILILNKYASAPQPVLNEPLRNTSVEWWGNPWLPSNELCWGGVAPKARDMVSDWLKSEFIEAFFAKLAQDGVGDRRRANFWLRYVKSMNNVQFALGSQALHSRDRDFDILRKKMQGLYTELKSPDSANNAFIMTMGNLVAVEFGGLSNAFYGYDARKQLPFDLSRSVGTTVDAYNSLKHRNRILWMQHQDGIKGWSKWEDMFSETLKQNFNIFPDTTNYHVASNLNSSLSSPSEGSPNSQPSLHRKITTSSESVHFNLAEFAEFARREGLKVEDLSDKNGNIWVRVTDNDIILNKELNRWGFQYKPGKGWWR